MDLIIRRAERSDLRAVLRLYAQPDFDTGRVLPLARAEAIYERMQSYPDYWLYVAEDQGDVVGTFGLLIMDRLGHVGTPSARSIPPARARELAAS